MSVKEKLLYSGLSRGGCEPIALQRRFSTVNVFLDGITPTLEAGAGQGGNNMPMILENHPADSRLTISKDNIVQTLSSRMGTGGATRLCLWIMNR